MIKVFDHDFTDSETSDQLNFKLESGIPNAMLNNFYDGRIFMSVMELISTFSDTSINHASIFNNF